MLSRSEQPSLKWRVKPRKSHHREKLVAGYLSIMAYITVTLWIFTERANKMENLIIFRLGLMLLVFYLIELALGFLYTLRYVIDPKGLKVAWGLTNVYHLQWKRVKKIILVENKLIVSRSSLDSYIFPADIEVYYSTDIDQDKIVNIIKKYIKDDVKFLELKEVHL